jgi:hypothetical protein
MFNDQGFQYFNIDMRRKLTQEFRLISIGNRKVNLNYEANN